MAVATLAEEVARELLGPEGEVLAPEASEVAVLRILDTLAVALAGVAAPPARAARALAVDRATAAGVPVWGSGRRAPAELAVLANATAAHALDYDDANYDAVMHLGAVTVPVALAVGEEQGAGGREVLAAVVAGYQLGAFLGKGAYRRFQPGGFHSSSVLGVFAAVATAGRLRGLSAATLVDALGIAGSMASGVMEFLKSGGDTKPLQVGWAARSGLAAVALAEAGASGPPTVLEGEYGIFRSFAGTQVDPEEALRRPFWEVPEIERAATKFYEVCGAIHGPADAWKEVLAAMAADGIDPVEELASATCTLSGFAARLVCFPEDRKRRPASAHEARFSLPWCLARIALDGDVDAASFAEASLFDPRALDLADRVGYRILDPGEERDTLARVEAVTRAGTTYRAAVGHAAREGRDPERIRAKVRRAVGAAATPEAAEALVAAADDLRRGGTLGALSKVLDEIVPGGATR